MNRQQAVIRNEDEPIQWRRDLTCMYDILFHYFYAQILVFLNWFNLVGVVKFYQVSNFPTTFQ